MSSTWMIMGIYRKEAGICQHVSLLLATDYLITFTINLAQNADM